MSRMKIAIPVDENEMNTSVCASFGRAPYFLVYDTETSKSEFIRNTAADAPGGAGIRAAQFVVDSGADVLLAVRLGQNAADVLVAAEIKVYKTIFATVRENIDAFAGGKLAPMTQFHAGFHGNP
jgi:predicted Fe-Mo cluster-binding NifX family protein